MLSGDLAKQWRARDDNRRAKMPKEIGDDKLSPGIRDRVGHLAKRSTQQDSIGRISQDAPHLRGG
jgi:hypothetical protein